LEAAHLIILRPSSPMSLLSKNRLLIISNLIVQLYLDRIKIIKTLMKTCRKSKKDLKEGFLEKWMRKNLIKISKKIDYYIFK